MKMQNKLPAAVKAWAWYDFANSGYILLYSSFLLPAYFSTVLLGEGYPLTTWGLANSISTVLGLFLALVGGRFSDKKGKIRTLKTAVLLTFLGMAGVSICAVFFKAGVLTSFVLTQAVFIFTLSLSDSVLPHLSRSTNAYRYSGFAWGLGYVGGIVSLALAMFLQSKTSEFSLPVFLSGALFYLIFSALALKGLERGIDLPEPKMETKEVSTRAKAQFLVGFWIVSECITVFILFFTLYCSKELLLSSTTIGLMLFLIQIIACPSTVWGGAWASRRGGLPVFFLAMTCMISALVLLVLPASWPALVAISVLGGLGVGNSQSVLRSHYALLVAPERSGAEFGVYSLVSQAAVILGPILYGLTSDHLDSQKVPILVLAALMAVGSGIVIRSMSHSSHS